METKRKERRVQCNNVDDYDPAQLRQVARGYEGRLVEEARRITIRDLLEKRKRRGKRAKRWAFRLGALGKQERARIG